MSAQGTKALGGAEPREVVIYGSARGFAQDVAVGGATVRPMEIRR
jgi:hypothetical protein